jgi:hypothetical protein
MQEYNVVIRLPPARSHERNEPSEPLAGVDRIEHEGFKGTCQFDRLDRRFMRDTVSRSGMAGDDLHVGFIQRRPKQARSGLRISDNVASHPLCLGIDVDPNHACAFESNRRATRPACVAALPELCTMAEAWNRQANDCAAISSMVEA